MAQRLPFHPALTQGSDPSSPALGRKQGPALGPRWGGCRAHPPEAAAWRQVLPRLSGVLISKPADSTCSLLSEDTMLYN